MSHLIALSGAMPVALAHVVPARPNGYSPGSGVPATADRSSAARKLLLAATYRGSPSSLTIRKPTILLYSSVRHTPRVPDCVPK